MGLVWLQERILRSHVSKKDWTACSKHDNHFRLNSQQYEVGRGEGLYNLFNEHGNLRFDNG